MPPIQYPFPLHSERSDFLPGQPEPSNTAGTATDTIVEEKVKVTEPSKYNVVFHNDDVTPMDYVIAILMKVFRHDGKTAYDLTMQIHHTGGAVVGTYTKEIAEAKKEKVDAYNQSNGYNLRVTVEKE